MGSILSKMYLTPEKKNNFFEEFESVLNSIINNDFIKSDDEELFKKNIFTFENTKVFKSISKYIILIILFIILVLNIDNVKSLFADTNNEKIDNQELIYNKPIFEVNTDFLQAYMSGSQVAADDKYKDKRFTVRGIVAEITNVYEPIIKVETEVGEVECVFDKSQSSELAKLSIAQKVVIECTFKGIITSARFENCKIVE